MNIALHGLETHITAQFPKAQVVRYADDLIALHPDLTGITQIQQAMSKWLAQPK
jgi:hypothetical protein